MKRPVTIKKNHEFRRLYAKGRSAASPRLVIYCRRNNLAVSRLGITVSTKIGKAVTRNRVRRRFREIFRLSEDRLAPGWDIIMVARTKSVTSEYSLLRDDFYALAKKLGVLRREA